MAEKLLLLFIKRLASESSPCEDFLSSRCAEAPEGHQAANRSSTFKGKAGVTTGFRISQLRPAPPPEAVISTVLRDLEAQIKDPQRACLEESADC